MVRLLVGFEYLQIAFIGDIKMPGFEFDTFHPTCLQLNVKKKIVVFFF